MTRTLTLLGATGSIGASTLDLVRRNRDQWRVEALTANCSAAELARLAREFGAELAVVGDEAACPNCARRSAGTGIEAAGGAQALCEAAATARGYDRGGHCRLCGLGSRHGGGGAGRHAGARQQGSAGFGGRGILMAAVARHGATLLPTDSEHNAIFQCLQGNAIEDVRWITLTASGGPFREWSQAQLDAATREQAREASQLGRWAPRSASTAPR
jgi:1-deoxy-D-xylulose-5-phosphate reductoisomerase